MIEPMPQFEGMSVTFQVTEDCNLRCKYCYEVDKQPRTLPLEYAKKFIDLLITEDDPILVNGTEEEWISHQGLILDFIGGDAFMHPNLVDEILEYFCVKMIKTNHPWGRRWKANISTNGTLFNNPDVQRLMYKYGNNMNIGVSIDGCPEIHNYNRSDSMDAIRKGYHIYRDWCKIFNSSEGTKATLTKESIPYLLKSVKYLFEDMGIVYIHMNFIFEEMGLTEEDYVELDRQLELIVDYVYEHRHSMFLSLLSESFGIGDVCDNPTGNWCGSGSMPCLSVDGKIYPCFRFMPNTMHDRDKFDFYVGDVFDGFTHKDRFNEVRSQTRDKISEDTCMNCPIESKCSWCIGGAFSETGTFWRPTNLCRVNRIIDKWARVYWNRYNESEGIANQYKTIDYSKYKFVR